MNRPVALIVAVMTCAGGGLASAANDALPLESRVRVVAPAISRKPIVGRLVASDEAALWIRRTEEGLFSPGWPFRRRGGETLMLPRESVTRFERSVRPSRKRLGATIGALFGATAMVVMFERATTGEDEGCSGCGALAMLVAVPFAMLGYAIAPGDRWAAEDPRKVHVAFIRPRGGGVGVRLSLAF
jgi:hypothetical protein